MKWKCLPLGLVLLLASPCLGIVNASQHYFVNLYSEFPSLHDATLTIHPHRRLRGFFQPLTAPRVEHLLSHRLARQDVVEECWRIVGSSRTKGILFVALPFVHTHTRRVQHITEECRPVVVTHSTSKPSTKTVSSTLSTFMQNSQ